MEGEAWGSAGGSMRRVAGSCALLELRLVVAEYWIICVVALGELYCV